MQTVSQRCFALHHTTFSNYRSTSLLTYKKGTQTSPKVLFTDFKAKLFVFTFATKAMAKKKKTKKANDNTAKLSVPFLSLKLKWTEEKFTHKLRHSIIYLVKKLQVKRFCVLSTQQLILKTTNNAWRTVVYVKTMTLAWRIFFFSITTHMTKSSGQSSREKEKTSELSKPSHMISGPEGKINAFSSPFIAVLLEL